MKHEEASLQTRKALSAALKAQMEHKPLRKITVNDLIGMCRGTLTWTEQGSALQGTLHFLHRANPFSGQVCSAGRRVFSGQIQTLVSRIPYQADCVLAGSGLTGTFHTASGDYAIVGEAFGPESTLSEETT